MRLLRVFDILVNPHPTLTIHQSDPECLIRKTGHSHHYSIRSEVSMPAILSHTPRTPMNRQTRSFDSGTPMSYGHRRVGSPNEQILNQTCSLDEDSFSFTTNRVPMEIDNPFECRFSTFPSPASCYSAASQSFQLVDKNSGVVFESVAEGTRGSISAQDIGFTNMMHNLGYVAVSGVSTGSVSFSAHLVEELPVLALTLPTPGTSQSPIFVQQSPVTLPKFVAASVKFLDDSLSSSLVPAPPECVECVELRRQRREEFFNDSDDISEDEWFCRDCHRQWLACQVWYQASDGGRRQHLREPFIKPAESNASNRALLEMMGIPTVSFNIEETAEEAPLRGMIIGIRDVSDSVGMGKRIGKRLKRSLKRTRRRRSENDEEFAMVGEMGQIQTVVDESTCLSRVPTSRRRAFWNSIKTILRTHSSR